MIWSSTTIYFQITNFTSSFTMLAWNLNVIYVAFEFLMSLLIDKSTSPLSLILVTFELVAVCHCIFKPIKFQMMKLTPSVIVPTFTPQCCLHCFYIPSFHSLQLFDASTHADYCNFYLCLYFLNIFEKFADLCWWNYLPLLNAVCLDSIVRDDVGNVEAFGRGYNPKTTNL